jgi:hypothetical protein
MDFCITRVDENGGTLLRIDGQLSRDGIEELRRALEASAAPITLELSGLRSADEPALAMLSGLRANGVTLVGASQYLELRMQSRHP